MATKSRTSSKRSAAEEAFQDIGTVKQILRDAYTPEASRAELVNAVSAALEELESYDESEDDSDDS